MKKKILIAIVMTIGAFVNVMAQTVTGRVLDASNSAPIVGVNVYLDGTTTGTITDIDGNFNLSVQDADAVLVFSFIGYETQKIAVGNQKDITVSLKSDMADLDEVVVVGYGVQKKSHLTGAISKVETTGLQDIPSSRADQILQGRVAGVQIQNTTSEVGESPNISIRGTGSISANSQPLVIVDGFPMSDGLSVVDVSDIESMEVLKDAASAAIYGSRAANGVIIVTTKSGQVDKPKYNVKMSYGIKDVYQLHPIMTTDEFIAMEVNEANIRGTNLSDQYFAMSTMQEETDWQNEAMRIADVKNAQFSVSGGKKGVRYYLSGTYLGDNGIMHKNSFDRVSVRSKLDADLSNRVKVGINMTPTFTKQTKPTNNFTDFFRTPGWMPIYHNDQTSAITGVAVGEYVRGADFNNKVFTGIDPQTGEERTVTSSPFNTSNNNPKMVMDNEFYDRSDYRMQTSGYLDVKIMKGLNFKTTNGFNVVYTDENEYWNTNSRKAGQLNRGLYNNRLFVDLLSENNLTYQTNIGKHSIDALAGFSAQERTTKTAGILGADFPTDYIHTLNAAGSILQFEETDLMTGTWMQDESLVSFYSRLAYAYDDKYLLSASFRADGSSKFGVNNRWGSFPSVSLGWRVSEEGFFKENVAWVTQLKLRASYGITGTDDIPNYANTNTLQANNYVLGSGTGSVVSGLSNTSLVLGNNSLQWEQTNESNFGLDFAAFGGRVSLGVDYYYSITRSLLYERALSSVSGFTRVWSNKGKVRNKGLEIVLNTVNVRTNDLQWSTGFNFSLNRNRVLDLAGPEQLINQGERNESYLTRVGDPIVQFYGWKAIGVWNTQEEIDNNPSHPNDTPGGLRIADVNNDGVIDANDYTVIGNPLPDFNFGITNTLNYKGFDLSFLIQGVMGVDVINGDLNYNETKRYNKNYTTNRWINAENPGDGQTPYFNNGVNQMLTSYAVEDASYVALRDLSLGYTLPKSLLKQINLSAVRMYVSGQNLLYWWSSDYRGINPEARRTSSQYSSPLVNGYQRGAFPVQRVYSVGLEVSF